MDNVDVSSWKRWSFDDCPQITSVTLTDKRALRRRSARSKARAVAWLGIPLTSSLWSFNIAPKTSNGN
jgi:hypothetical protein